MAEYIRLLGIIKQELLHPVADTYNLIVSVLYYLLVIINRAYAATYHLPIDVPKNNYAFQFKDLLEKNIRTKQRVQEYADMLRVSRITLNSSVMSQFGVSANHLLKQRLLEELKNELLFANRNVNQLAEEFHFSDPSHLMRFFKRETGKTFTQYLRDYQMEYTNENGQTGKLADWSFPYQICFQRLTNMLSGKSYFSLKCASHSAVSSSP